MPYTISRIALPAACTGEGVDAWTLSHTAGVAIEVVTLGATLTSVRVGGVEIAPAHRSSTSALEASARAGNPYYGATIGRVANRTAGAIRSGTCRQCLGGPARAY